MKYNLHYVVLAFAVVFWGPAIRAQNLVILDEAGTRNLGIETASALPSDFEQTRFALGRIEALPGRAASASPRVSGRIIELHAFEGDVVTKGQPLAQIESLQVADQPSRVTLSAPSDGRILRSRAQLGAPVSPETALFEMADLDEVYAVARIPQDLAASIAPDTEARVRLIAVPSLDARASFERFAPTANDDQLSIDAYFRLSNEKGLARPGLRAEFAIILEKRLNTLSVPKESVLSDAMGQFVFVRDYDLPNAFQKATVKVGLQNDRQIEIVAGLFPGDEVVTRGAYALQFAGAGTISLKEALDAAHGHEHNEDGSEMTAEQRASRSSSSSSEHHNHALSHPLLIFFASLSGLLLLLLTLSVRRRTA